MILIYVIIIHLIPPIIGQFNHEPHIWSHPNANALERLDQIYKKQVQGCTTKETLTEPIVCIIGYECKNYPTAFRTHKEMLKIKMTSIKELKRNDLDAVTHMFFLSIEYNLELRNLETGCFRKMNKLSYLKITLNPKLTYLEENIFDGLDNLVKITLRKNGFKRLPDIFQTLAPNKLPKLRVIDLSENSFQNIFKDDFQAMNSSGVTRLELSLCGIENIHEESLIVFKKLLSLDLSQNHITAHSMSDIILKFVEHQIPLDVLNLEDLGYRRRAPFPILEAISKSNITTLSLAKNQLEQLDQNDFPIMSKIKSLDLRGNLIIVIGDNTFEGFSNLQFLYLAGNKFSKIYPAFLLPQLKSLDLSMISGKLTAVSYFNIANNMFINMSKLEDLSLSFNLIETITKDTFTGLKNLNYLELKNATLFSVEPGSFKNNHKLTYLNLENNPLQAITLTSETFRGLPLLKTLLLGGCNLYNLSVEPTPFYNLTNLMYLALNNNALYTLTAKIFAPLRKLQNLDLSSNKLIPWTDRLFENMALKYVDFSQNKFTYFTQAMLDDFRLIKYLNLDGNPIICDCNLFPKMSIEDIMNYYNTDLSNAKCTNLDVWEQRTINDYIVYLKNNPHVCNKSSNKVILITLLTIFLVLLTIVLILIFLYRQYVRYWLFLAKMAVRRHSKWWKKTPEQTTGFTYDAFVSYSCEDCFFINKLVSQLEESEPHLKLCVYERDFKIGSVISEEVLHSVLKSRRTLLVISDGFAKSQWCRWETKLAEYHQIFFQNDDATTLDDTLVMVKLNHVPKKYITPTLKYLMKTRIYLQWNPEKEQEFWEKLRHTLSAPKQSKHGTENDVIF